MRIGEEASRQDAKPQRMCREINLTQRGPENAERYGCADEADGMMGTRVKGTSENLLARRDSVAENRINQMRD